MGICNYNTTQRTPLYSLLPALIPCGCLLHWLVVKLPLRILNLRLVVYVFIQELNEYANETSYLNQLPNLFTRYYYLRVIITYGLLLLGGVGLQGPHPVNLLFICTPQPKGLRPSSLRSSPVLTYKYQLNRHPRGLRPLVASLLTPLEGVSHRR